MEHTRVFVLFVLITFRYSLLFAMYTLYTYTIAYLRNLALFKFRFQCIVYTDKNVRCIFQY